MQVASRKADRKFDFISILIGEFDADNVLIKITEALKGAYKSFQQHS